MADITLFRGLRNEMEMICLAKYGTAGGMIKANSIPPTPAQIANFLGPNGQKFTAGECYPPKKKTKIITEMTEYSLNPDIAIGFSRRSCIVATIVIDENLVHIIDNDDLEFGVIIRSDVPYSAIIFRGTDNIFVPRHYNPKKYRDHYHPDSVRADAFFSQFKDEEEEESD